MLNIFSATHHHLQFLISALSSQTLAKLLGTKLTPVRLQETDHLNSRLQQGTMACPTLEVHHAIFQGVGSAMSVALYLLPMASR